MDNSDHLSISVAPLSAFALEDSFLFPHFFLVSPGQAPILMAKEAF